MNRIEMIGRICNKIESQISEEESKRPLVVVLAVDMYKRNKESNEIVKEAIFVPLKAWGKIANRIRTYKSTGDELFVEGHVQTGSYDNKDGDKIYFTDLIIDKVEFLRNTNNNKNTNTNANTNNKNINTNVSTNTNTNNTDTEINSCNEFEEVSSFDGDSDMFGDMPFSL